MLSSTCAWTSTPGMAGSFGVVFRSSRPAAEVPIRTSRARHAVGGDAAFEHDRRPTRSAPGRAARNEPRAGRCGRSAFRSPGSATLLMPASSILIRMVLAPVATRSISNDSDGMMLPCACITIGTRRTMPSRSVRMLNRPRPAAACSRTGMLRSSPGKLNRNGFGSPPSAATPTDGGCASGCGTDDRQAGLAEHDPRLLDGVGHDLVVARQRAQLVPRLLVEIAIDVRRERRRQPVRLGEDDVEGDRGGAELGQPRDQVGDARARPRPLAELAQAFLVDIDDDDRPLRGDAGLDDLEEIEGPQAQLFERARIGDAQEHQREQQRHAQCSRGCEPPPQTRKPFHVEPAERAADRCGLPRHFSRNIRIS